MYCVNCGVELADSETVCPLCGTRVFHPDLPRKQAPSPYPADPHGKPEEVNRSGILFVMTMLALLPAVICLLCDWRSRRSTGIGGVCMQARRCRCRHSMCWRAVRFRKSRRTRR